MRTLAVLAVLAMLSACGSDGSGGSAAPTPSELNGSTYHSTDVTGHDLVAGSTVTLTFDDGSLAVHAGCNTQSAAYEVDNGTLRWTSPPAATMMACPPDLEAQDRWLATLFTDGADASLDGSTLTLTTSDVTMVLQS